MTTRTLPAVLLLAILSACGANNPSPNPYPTPAAMTGLDPTCRIAATSSVGPVITTRMDGPVGGDLGTPSIWTVVGTSTIPGGTQTWSCRAIRTSTWQATVTTP